jgi:hypothetical protein
VSKFCTDSHLLTCSTGLPLCNKFIPIRFYYPIRVSHRRVAIMWILLSVKTPLEETARGRTNNLITVEYRRALTHHTGVVLLRNSANTHYL